MRRVLMAILLGIGLGVGMADAAPPQAAGSAPVLAAGPVLLVPAQYNRPYYGPPPRRYGQPRYAPPPRRYYRPRHAPPPRRDDR